MRIVFGLLYVFAAWRWADWRKWERCYPTFLFYLVSNYLEGTLASNHVLWLYHPTFLLPNHTISDFYIAFVSGSVTLLLYLSKYPSEGIYKQAMWNGIFIASYTITEAITHALGTITYEHGWSLGWSAMFNLVMFPLLRVHYLKPGRAWVLAGALGLFIWIHFGFSLQELK